MFTDEAPTLKPVLSRNFLSPVKNRPNICVFWRKWGQTYVGGAKSPKRIVIQFCTGVDVRDIITPADFGSYRFRRFRMAGVEFQVFSLTFNVPCQRVVVKAEQGHCLLRRTKKIDFYIMYVYRITLLFLQTNRQLCLAYFKQRSPHLELLVLWMFSTKQAGHSVYVVAFG